MAHEPHTTIIGNLTDDPELRFTHSGKPVTNFTIASTPRFYNKDTQAWEQGDPLFMRCNLWGKQAENVADSLQKGANVIATGTLQQRQFVPQTGEERQSIELNVDEIGPALRFQRARVHRVPSNSPNRYEASVSRDFMANQYPGKGGAFSGSQTDAGGFSGGGDWTYSNTSTTNQTFHQDSDTPF